MPGMAEFFSTTPTLFRRPFPSLKPDTTAILRMESTMKAFVVDKYKKKGALRLANLPEPEIRDDDVLVQVGATGVNVLDSKVRDGEFKLILPYRPPFILGHDVAGIVVRVGRNVRQFKVGDEVYARPRDHRVGTFAEFIAMNEADVAPKPKNISMEEAASIPLVGLTAWQALVEVGKLKPRQKVFIQAGSGGVGTFAIQLAKHLGGIVATTTSAKNVGWLRVSARTWSSITRPRISRRPCRATIWSCTARTPRRLKNLCAC